MFGQKLPHVLWQSHLEGLLPNLKVFANLAPDQMHNVASLSQLVELEPGQSFEQPSTCLAVCLDGEVEASMTQHGQPRGEPCTLTGAGADQLGEKQLIEQGGSWTLHMVAADNKRPARLAVWHGKGLDQVLHLQFGSSETGRTARSQSAAHRSSMRVALAQNDKVGALRKVLLFRTLSKDQLRQLSDSLKVDYVSVGDTIFSQGDEGKEFFIIHSGQVEVLINDRVIRTMGMGDYFGDRALLFNEPRSATVKATEDCELWKMDRETFAKIVHGPILEYMKDRIAFQKTEVDLETLECIRIVGRGGFGVVKMVQSKTTKTRYALKCVRIRQAVEQRQQKGLMLERSILAELDHPFVIKFVRTFLGSRYIYFLMELVTGGELLDALDSLGLLKKSQAQFYTGSIALALEFLHERRIAYLDLKGENCLVDQHGYLKIIDFGVAERVRNGRIHAVKGTPLFMAPEVVLGKGYTTSADLWSLGICVFDFMFGKFPFGSESMGQTDIFHAILKQPLNIPKSPPRDKATISLLEDLLNRDPGQRPGAGPLGYEEIKAHAFFKGFDWEALLSRQLEAPFKPAGEIYAEDQENPDNKSQAQDRENPRQTVADLGLASCDKEGEDDDWQDPDPAWQEDFR